jgi:hypothetical protein
MTSHLCVICTSCNTIALNSSCECGLVASKESNDPRSCLYVFSDSPESIILTKVWTDASGVVTFLKKYKDLFISRIVPINVKENNDVS